MNPSGSAVAAGRLSAASTVGSVSSDLVDGPDASPPRRRSFLLRLFSRQPRASTEPLTSALVAPRSLPRALSSAAFTKTLLAIWDERSDSLAAATYRECVGELSALRSIRVLEVTGAGSHGTAAVTVELTTAAIESSAPRVDSGGRPNALTLTMTRTSTRPFGDYRLLLKLLEFCAKADCHCGRSDGSSRQCEYQQALRQFLSLCWVTPPLVSNDVAALGGRGARGISKSVLTASLNDIVRLARGDAGGAAVGSSEGKASRRAPAQSSGAAPPVECRARLEVAVVVRDFVLPREHHGE